MTASSPSSLVTILVLAALSILPFALVLLTSFAKISVVLSILRSALGIPQGKPQTPWRYSIATM